MRFRASLAGSVALLVACALGGGCGGAVAPVIGGDGGGSSSSGGGKDAGPPIVDTGAPVDVGVPETPLGSCEPDGVPCSFASQCCTEVCGAGVCGGLGPSCTADGSPCQDSTECCSQLCTGDICEEPATSCAVSSNANPCDLCLAQGCCPQLASCESNTVCAESQTCFDSCYTGPGSGTKCVETCGMEYPSTQGELLEQCAANSCLTACE
jgi:hypothetical protein